MTIDPDTTPEELMLLALARMLESGDAVVMLRDERVPANPPLYRDSIPATQTAALCIRAVVGCWRNEGRRTAPRKD